MDFIKEFYNIWVVNKFVYDATTTEEKFRENMEGYVKFIIVEYQENDHSISITKNGKKYSILKGIYISPFSQSILGKENAEFIDGLLMDTT